MSVNTNVTSHVSHVERCYMIPLSSPPILCIFSLSVFPIFPCRAQRVQWTVVLIMSASNTLCLSLYVLLLLQNSLVVALGYGPGQRKTVLVFLDCLFSCSAVFHLLFHILVAGVCKNCHSHEEGYRL